MRSFSKPGVPLRPLLAMQCEQVKSFLLVFQLKYIHIPPWSLINRLKQFGVWFRCVEVFELGRHSVMSCTMRLESDSASGRTLRCAWLRGVHDTVSCTHDTHIVRKYNYFNFIQSWEINYNLLFYIYNSKIGILVTVPEEFWNSSTHLK